MHPPKRPDPPLNTTGRACHEAPFSRIPIRSCSGKSGRLFCPFPYQLGLPAARRSRVGVLHFVASDRYGSLLIGPAPIRKRAAFDVKVKCMIRLIERVGAKVRNSALYHRLIFIRRAFKTVIAREFPKPFAYERYSKVAICIEHEHAAWIRTKRLVLATIRAHTDIRGQRPSPYDLLFERLPLGEGIAYSKRQTQQRDGGCGES